MHICAEWGRHDQFLSKAAARLELKMSQSGQKSEGTGPGDVFDILVRAPPERLLSLILQLSESPEGNVLRVLCLIVLQKEREALSGLHTLARSDLSRHLSESWLWSRGNLSAFGARFADFRGPAGESLVLLARVFRVLSEQRLCEPHLRDVAYQRALSAGDAASDKPGLERLREEAAAACGPLFAEQMSSCVSRLGTLCLLDSSQDGGALSSLPSPLHANSSMLSYPTHLEISIPPTALLTEDRRTPETPETSKQKAPVVFVGEAEAKSASGPCWASEGAQLNSSDLASDRLLSPSFPASTPTTVRSFSAPSTCVPTDTPAACDLEECCAAEEEDATFYAFVVLHAPEDADVANDVREKVEKVINSKGATFSDDFHVPGKSTLRCVEDAINDTAFTILLLTRNFTTRMLELETNSALVNALEKNHKWNTVIPLLPLQNRMPKEDMPLVLQTIVPLEENKNFEKKIGKSMSLPKIKRQEKIWMQEQRAKIEKARKQQSKHQKKLMRQNEEAHNHSPDVFGGDDDRPRCQNIHIENAKYIMIGNDSQMTVGLAGGVDTDNSFNGEVGQ